MTGSRLSFHEQRWAELKPIIQKWYLDDNLTLLETIKRLSEEHGFQPTERQMKCKFQTWRWTKKLELDEYMAMYVIITKYNSNLVFYRPVRSEGVYAEKRPGDIRKEVTRKQKDRSRNGQSPPPQPSSIRDAVEVLQGVGVLVGSCREDALPIAKVIQVATGGIVTDDNDGSTISDSSLPEVDHLTDDTRELNDRNFAQQIPRLRLLTNEPDLSARPRQHDRFPYPDAFLTSLTTTLLPQPQSNALVEGLERDPLSNSIHVVNPEQLESCDDTLNDLPELFADRLCLLDPTDARRRQWEKFLGVQLDKYYRRHDLDSSKQLVVEFAAYYVQQCLAGFETLDPAHHPDRQEARRKNASMLDQNNALLLPTIFWIVTVIGSNDKLHQLSAFLDDCWDCVKESTSAAGRVIRPLIRAIVLMHRMNYDGCSSPTERQQKLRDLKTVFNGEKEFSESIDYLSAHGHRHSPTMLIVQCYYAWYLQQIEHFTKSREVLLNHVEVANRVMGLNHLVTVNYHFLISKCYERLGDHNLAENYIRMALVRLEGCSNPLRGYQHRILFRLAEMKMRQGNTEAALWGFEEVLRFRRETLGACSGSTWQVANTIFGILHGQGRSSEAQERETELRAQHDAEWRWIHNWSPAR